MFSDCPECGNPNYIHNHRCTDCGYICVDEPELWEYDFDSEVENNLFPIDRNSKGETK